MVLSSLCAGAFEFDSIDLNEPYYKVTQEISKRGYSYNHELNCLQGDCRGTVIYLSINYLDVTKSGMLGQLIVNIPFKSGEDFLSNAISIFNVLYHQVEPVDGNVAYQVDPDGTQLVVSRKNEFLTLTYNTPYYKH